MKNKRYLFLGISSVLFSSAYLFAPFCWFFVFFALTPLYFLVATRTHLSFIDGFFWGFCTFCLQYWAIIVFVVEHGISLQRYFFLFLFSAYVAAHAGIWFALADYFSKWLQSMPGKVFVWVAVTFVYFYFKTSMLFWLFGCLQGSITCCPLVPLMMCPHILTLISSVGKEVMTLALIGINASLTLALLYRWYWILLCFCLLLFFISYFNAPVSRLPAWMHSVAFLAPPKNASWTNYIDDLAQDIAQQLQTIVSVNHPRIVVGPETTINFNLDTHKKYIDLWFSQALSDDMTLIIGGHRSTKINKKSKNVVYLLSRRRIIQTYDKKHQTIFTEYVPTITTWFYQKNKDISARKPLTLDGESIGIPVICSEYFFTSLADGISSQTIWLFVNDSWFSCFYMKRMLLMAAALKALENRQEILYISHDFFTYILKNGVMQQLPKI